MSLETKQIPLTAAIGSTIAQYLFLYGMTRADLGEVLGTTSQNISGRLHGRSKWTAEEMVILASYFGVTVNDLMPTSDGQGGWLPAPFVPRKAKGPVFSDQAFASVAGAGFEPTTSGL